MPRIIQILVIAALVLTIAAPGFAWGPKTQTAIVSNALLLISKNENIPLTRLKKDVQSGSLLSMDMLKELYPDLESNAVRAIEAEMALLQAVQGDKIDPYFAFRLGALGKLVAEITSPMQESEARYRTLYFADVSKNVQRATLKLKKREFVDPKTYFADVVAAANVHNELLQREYQNGTGFRGLAGTRLPEDLSRSVNAVADVWYTILTNTAVQGNISSGQLRNYVELAYTFYIRRANLAEIDAAEARLDRLVSKTADMQVRIGNLFFEGGFPDRAVKIYRAVLADDPNRRDVIDKIADYYVERGKKALTDKRLEGALDAFKQALDANPLHPSAERHRLETLTQIEARDARLAQDQAHLDSAEQFQALAEEEVLNDRYTEALVLLRRAQELLYQVSDEFPTENQRRIRNINNVRYRMQELKQSVVANAQSFSGSGFALDIQHTAQNIVENATTETLRALMKAEYNDELARLQKEMAPVATLK